MYKSLLLLVIAVSSLFLCGCPYESRVPFDSATENVNPLLLGKWHDPGNDNTAYIVTRLNAHEAKVVCVEKQKNNTEKKTILAGYTSIIGDKLMLTLKEMKDGMPKYTFYRLEPHGDIMKLTAVSDELKLTFSNSDELKKYFTAHINAPGFFEKDVAELVRSR